MAKRIEPVGKSVSWKNLYPYKINFSGKFMLERVGYGFELIYRGYVNGLYLGSIWIKIVKGKYTIFFPNENSKENLHKIKRQLEVWINENLPKCVD